MPFPLFSGLSSLDSSGPNSISFLDYSNPIVVPHLAPLDANVSSLSGAVTPPPPPQSTTTTIIVVSTTPDDVDVQVVEYQWETSLFTDNKNSVY